MSILLEALRKSEKSQHTREIPTIYAAEHSDPVAEPIKTGPLALMLVATLFMSGWFVWRQYQAPVERTELSAADTRSPAVAEQAPPVEAGTPVMEAPANAAAEAGHVILGTESPVVSQSEPAVVSQAESANPAADQEAIVTTVAAADGSVITQLSPADAISDSASRQQRTPMESYQGPLDAVVQSNPDETEPREATQAHPKALDGEVDQQPATVPEKHLPAEPAPISYWELPDAVRADLPEIKFSVLVYASKPADRFVLINGVRVAEGDSPLPGLTLTEIRRDGVVFNYRLYQFLVER